MCDLFGISRVDSLKFILALGRVALEEAEFEAVLTEKNVLYLDKLQHLRADDMLPGVARLLDELDSAEIRYAIGSSSRNARQVLTQLGILERFVFIADGNSPGRKKPAPDVFLYAAEGLGVSAENCIVIEDAPAGVQAAQAGNMACVAVGDPGRFGQSLSHARTLHTETLATIDLACLKQLVAA